MRWKITGQILGLLLVVLPVMYISLLVFSILLFGSWRSLTGMDQSPYGGAGQMTIQFEQYLHWEDNQFTVDPQKLEELRDLGVWLQVLDENGNEVYQQFKPPSAPVHYTPAELILNYKYSGAIKDETQGYTLFVAMADRGERKFSYILGFPDRDVLKATLSVNPQTFFTDILKVLGGAVIIVTLVIMLLAYLYGSRLAAPLAEIIAGIQHLARADYSHSYPERGIYGSVYHNLNKLAQSLQAHERERQRLETAREEWIANISHDVKTPLSSLKGYAELLADPDYHFSEAEVRRYAGIIQDKSVYMASLVEDLCLTYQLKNAALPLDRQHHNLVALLREAVIDLLNDPGYRYAQLSYDPMVEDVQFDGDRRLLHRAFTNLILNALVHNPPGTPVEVSISDGQAVSVAIQDWGNGIPAEEVAVMFERYYRGTNTGEAHKGSGLGMAIARQIIEAHNGSLRVASRPGEGTRVDIQFSRS